MGFFGFRRLAAPPPASPVRRVFNRNLYMRQEKQVRELFKNLALAEKREANAEKAWKNAAGNNNSNARALANKYKNEKSKLSLAYRAADAAARAYRKNYWNNITRVGPNSVKLSQNYGPSGHTNAWWHVLVKNKNGTLRPRKNAINWP